ncbi:MAG: T9SS type A sorting domain-containing protein [Ignavibacteria bacterium]|nr:T9SS type A sorting domain-containing protein [Ignavibacteria bacterium]
MARLICIILIFFIFVFGNLYPQATRKNQSKDAAVLISVKTFKTPPMISLKWEKHPLAYRYEVRRKNFGDLVFPATPLANLDSSLTSYDDTRVEVGKEYEYEIRAYYRAFIDVQYQKPDGTIGDTTIDAFMQGFGYVHTGINVPPRHSQGKVLLLIDQTLQASLQLEIEQLIDDLIGEGWSVAVKYVPRVEGFDGAKVKQVKELILEEYGKDPLNFNTVFIIGRVPVPYSGNIVPDGHPDHQGAWPCDMYYGSIYEDYWTDVSINRTTANDTRNHNVPGDGKFDQSTPGNEISIAVGRVDFYNMPKFSESEVELIRAYLNKNHKFRTGELNLRWRGLVDDNFGASRLINAFASSGYRNFASLLGPNNVRDLDWFTTLKTDDYLWAYGCGGGTYTSAGGIGSTDDFVANRVNSVFTMLFGSYFGDWDSRNNFMRAALASKPSILTCSWAGFPHWYFHNMAANLPIGYSTRLTQSNATNYLGALFSQNGQQYYVIGQGLFQIHVALMGDPTLTMFSSAVPPPKNLNVYQPAGGFVQINWEAPNQENEGYFVYRSYSKFGDYVLLNKDPIKTTSFVDSSLYEGIVYYMVRAVRTIENNSGSFSILSRGTTQYARITSVEANTNDIVVHISPNPTNRQANLRIELPFPDFINAELFSLVGARSKAILSEFLAPGTHSLSFELTDSFGNPLPSGVYILKITTSRKVYSYKIVKIEQ